MRNPVAADGSKQNMGEMGDKGKGKGKETSGWGRRKEEAKESVATQDEMFT